MKKKIDPYKEATASFIDDCNDLFAKHANHPDAVDFWYAMQASASNRLRARKIDPKPPQPQWVEL